MTTLTFRVTGTPAPKGSLRHVGNGRLVEQVKGSAPWRKAVAAAASDAADVYDVLTLTGPVEVCVDVVVARPRSALRRVWPITRSSGDIDKHARNILDALVDAGVIRDDSQVVSLNVSKTYGDDGRAGAYIRVAQVTP